MLQSAFRRVLLQSGVTGFVPSQFGAAAAACGTGSKIGTQSSNSSGDSNGSRSSHGESFQPDFHIPSLFGSKSSSEDTSKAAPAQPFSPSLLALNARSPSSILSTPFAAKRPHALNQQQPLLCGLAARSRFPSLPLRHPAPAMDVQTRAYGSDGELLGAAYIMTTDIMFWSGLIGAVVFRRNIIVMLLCTEILMLACNMNFLFASAYLNDMTGVIMSITITTIAACETAIGLALCVTYFHIRSATDVEALNLLK